MSTRSSTQLESEYRNAIFHYEQRNGDQAIKIAVALSDAGHDQADFLLGLIFEFGTSTSKADIARAVRHYRKAALACRSAIGNRHLARALMKLGQSAYDEAFRCLSHAAFEEPSPEVDLGFAWYYETKAAPEYEMAQRHYLRAALNGRFLGFSGYSRVSRLAGQSVRALFVDCIRVAVGIPCMLIFGKKAQNTF
jgi:TPR repeat protein